MKLGVFTPVFASLTTEQMLAKVRALRHVEAIEVGTGGWPGRSHLDDLDEMIHGACRATTYRQMVADAGLTISALSCHGNPLHPDRARAAADDETFRKSVLPRRQRDRRASELDHDRLAARIPRGARLAVGAEGHPVLA